MVQALPAILGAVATIGSSVIGAIASNSQAKDAAKRQQEYQNQLAAQEAATVAEEKRLTEEAKQRSKAYGASLLDSGTNLQNMLSGGYSNEQVGGSLLTTGLGSGTATGTSSMFS